MIELLKSINENYGIFIDTNKIHKLGTTTINDIFLINIDNKKYIVKIYNVDEEKQIKNSLYTQKNIFQSLKITADFVGSLIYDIVNFVNNKDNEEPQKFDYSLAVFMPFKVQEIRHENGVFYGQNTISKNMIIADRRQLLNGNSFILGVSGSGKSFAGKQEITSIRLRDPNADIIIIDPEREYSPLVKSLGGEVIKISATSNNHMEDDLKSRGYTTLVVRSRTM